MIEKPSEHVSVLLSEALSALTIRKDGTYIDGTFGRGGHSRAILAQLGEKGRLLVLDQDPEAIKEAHTIQDPRLSIFQARFSQLKNIVIEQNLVGQVDGILLDIGVSSPQLDQAERGFSFMQDGPLDMRMDPTQGESVAEWLAYVKEETLANVIFQYGEERYSRRIARAIVEARKQQALTSTLILADIIAKAHPKWEPHKNPATRTFQALRIFINKELEELSTCLSQCEDILKTEGILAVISFHSLEDRLVKEFGRAKKLVMPRRLPLTNEQLSIYQPKLRALGKAIKPNAMETAKNPRSRSATLRVMEKTE
jgi:16S rRNA (cytosine1402-N4)-methyltransferase